MTRAPYRIGPRDTPTEAEVAAYEAKPVWVGKPRQLIVASLLLGLKGRAIDFSWRPYNDRTAEERADYDRLRASIAADGLLKPLIVWRDPFRSASLWHVLIGQRRAEIARTLGIRYAWAVPIREDVRTWWRHDVPRLERLKQHIGEVDY